MKALAAISAILGSLTTLGTATTVVYGPIHYYSEADSPFFQGIEEGSMYFENFEDQALNVPYVSIISGRLTENRRPSIDGDDGSISNTPAGYSYRTTVGYPAFTINFEPDALGRYPRYFGVAFPSIVDDSITSQPDQVLGLTDAFGATIFNSLRIRMIPFDPLIPANSTYYHSFLGVFNDTGISQVMLHWGVYIDHLQYGYEIPEWGAGWGMGAVGVLLFLRRARAGSRSWSFEG
jgi:hypothetical protein